MITLWVEGSWRYSLPEQVQWCPLLEQGWVLEWAGKWTWILVLVLLLFPPYQNNLFFFLYSAAPSFFLSSLPFKEPCHFFKF